MNGSVKIINYNANADSIVAAAGRISTTLGSAEEIYVKSCESGEEKNRLLIKKILASGHKSVLEHVSVNLAFDNVSVFVEQFMIEFRLASFTVKSRRYVDFAKMGYYVPDFAGDDRLQKMFCDHMDELFAEYEEFVQQGIPKEDARFVLPYCFRSNFYCTLNARELEMVMSEMLYGRGKQYPEIRELGQSLYCQCQEVLPYLEPKENTGKESGYVLASFAGKCTERKREEGLISLLAGTEEPERIICEAAVSAYGITLEDIDEEKQKKILKELLGENRKRALEQAHFTFRFNRISLAGLTHLVRHRMQSIVTPDLLSVCDAKHYVLPQTIEDAGLALRYTEIFEKNRVMTEKLIAEGMYEKDAVYLLLSGMTVPVVTTMNANELETFIRLRTCNRAQWEIKACADELLMQLRGKYPMLFSLYGPGCCMYDRCPEGKMTCGKMQQMRGLYKERN